MTGGARRLAVVVLLAMTAAAALVRGAAPAAADPVVGPVITAGNSLGDIAVDEALHRVYLSDEKTSTLLAVDGATNTVVGTLGMPVRGNGQTHELAADPQTHRVYVTTDQGLLAVDGPAMTVAGRPGGGTALTEPQVVPSTGRVYALNVFSTGNGPRVQLVVFSATAVLTTVDVGGQSSGCCARLAVDTAADVLYVTGTTNGTTMVDGATNKASILRQGGDGPTAADPVLHRLYAVDELAAALNVIDPSADKLITTVPLGPPPASGTPRYIGPVAVDDRLRLAYVTGGAVNGAARADVITVVDLVANKVQSVLPVNGVVAVDTVASRGYAAQIAANRVTVLLGDTVAPDTTVTSAPTSVAQGGTATVRFVGSDNVTSPASLRFSCAVDTGAFAPCTSPAAFTLPPGTHRVAIRALDQAGNLETSPAIASFTVAGPTAAVTTSVAGVTTTTARIPGTTVRGRAGAVSATTTTAPARPAPTASSLPGQAAAPAVTPTAPLPGSTQPPTLVVVTASGAVAGPPGVGLRVEGSGFPPSSCPRVFVFLGRDRLGTATPGADGRFVADRLAVPGDSAAGPRDVVASCHSSSDPPAATHLFTIEDRSIHRPALVSALHLPSQVPLGAKDLGLSALVAAALVLLVAFPSELFDSTLAENAEEVKGWFRWVAPLVRPFSRMGASVATAILLGIAALLFGLLDPGFGLDLASAAEFLGLVLSLLVVTAVFSLPALVYMRRRHGDRGRIDVLPGGLVIAGMCVLASRLLHFQPGYLYGVVVGVAFAQELPAEEDGRVSALSTAVMLVVAVVAWVVWAVVQPSAAGASPSPALVILETTLAAVAVAGVESAVITLLPMRFLVGAKVMAWSRAAWAGLLGLALFAFVHVLLRPGSGYVGADSGGSALAVVILFVAFALGSLLFWAYFRFRPPRTRHRRTPEGVRR